MIKLEIRISIRIPETLALAKIVAMLIAHID